MVSTKQDYNNSRSFEDFKKNRMKEIRKQHSDNVVSWLKTHKAVVAKTSVQSGVSYIPVPFLKSAVGALGAGAFGISRLKGHNTREEMVQWARTQNITQLSLEELCKVEVDPGNLSKWLSWYGSEGIDKMFDADKKLMASENALKKEIQEFNANKTPENYLELVDVLLYHIYRLRRTREYANILLVLSANLVRSRAQTLKEAENDLKAKLVIAGKNFDTLKQKKPKLG
jgi:hypothetical protein